MRVAAVDLGTNTTRLLVADVVDGRLEPVVRREAITRLGESVDRRRVLLPTSIARVRNVLVDYRRKAERLGAERVLAVGTSAVRDAENGEAAVDCPIDETPSSRRSSPVSCGRVSMSTSFATKASA